MTIFTITFDFSDRICQFDILGYFIEKSLLIQQDVSKT